MPDKLELGHDRGAKGEDDGEDGPGEDETRRDGRRAGVVREGIADVPARHGVRMNQGGGRDGPLVVAHEEGGEEEEGAWGEHGWDVRAVCDLT